MADLFTKVKDFVGESALYQLTRELMRRGYDKRPPPPPPPLTPEQKDYIRKILKAKGMPEDRRHFEASVDQIVEQQYYAKGSTWPDGVVCRAQEHPHNGDLVVNFESTFIRQGWEWIEAGMPEEGEA